MAELLGENTAVMFKKFLQDNGYDLCPVCRHKLEIYHRVFNSQTVMFIKCKRCGFESVIVPTELYILGYAKGRWW